MLYGRLPTTRSLARRARGQRGEVDLQHVGLDDLELRMLAQARRRGRDRARSRSACPALDQRLRQRGQPGPDLHHRLARARIDLAHDGVDDAASARKCWPKRLRATCFMAADRQSMDIVAP
jgi:hypothetical protein